MDIKKNIDQQEHLKCDCQNMSISQYERIKEMNDCQNSLTLEISSQVKHIETLSMEANLNDEKIKSQNDLLQLTTEKLHETL